MLEAYSEEWPITFEKERLQLASELGGLSTDIQHIGSTAVPGLLAKPIIDIMVAVPSLGNAGALHPILERLGYTYRPDLSSSEREFFCKGNPAEFHLSIAQPDHTSYWQRQILFRDFLISHPDYAKEYAQLKIDSAKDLATEGVTDISLNKAYSARKTEFVQKILQLAKLEN